MFSTFLKYEKFFSEVNKNSNILEKSYDNNEWLYVEK